MGTGNLVGVAGAVCLGGPGAVFWMWICGILGMATKYAEVALAVRYREKTSEGYIGGPMYTILNGLGEKWRPMASCYCVFGVIAAFGVGNAAQINAVMTGVDSVLQVLGREPRLPIHLLLGILLALLIGVLLQGGARRIGAAAETLIPFAAAAYILLCAGVLVIARENLPGAVASIFRGLFRPGPPPAA